MNGAFLRCFLSKLQRNLAGNPNSVSCRLLLSTDKFKYKHTLHPKGRITIVKRGGEIRGILSLSLIFHSNHNLHHVSRCSNKIPEKYTGRNYSPARNGVITGRIARVFVSQVFTQLGLTIAVGVALLISHIPFMD